MLSSVSVSSATSITTTLALGVTVATVLLSVAFISLLIMKELSVTYDGIDTRVNDSLNAVLIPLTFAFVVIMMFQAFA